MSLSDNARMVDDFQKAGVDLTPGAAETKVDLAHGKDASASCTTSSPASQATSPRAPSTADLQRVRLVQRDNPIRGDVGSPNAQDWLQVDLGAPTRFNDVKLYFYSNKAFGSGGNTYRQPSDYSVEYFDGNDWVDVPGQVKTPATPAPNYNQDAFAPVVTAQLVRVLMTRQSGFGVGVKEVQVFDTNALPVVTNDAPDGGVSVHYGGSLSPTVTVSATDPDSDGSKLNAGASGSPRGCRWRSAQRPPTRPTRVRARGL